MGLSTDRPVPRNSLLAPTSLRFSPPLLGDFLSVDNVADKEQTELFIMPRITPQPINNYHEIRLLKEMSTEKVLLAMDWSVL